jgi:hypothetical protein
MNQRNVHHNNNN